MIIFAAAITMSSSVAAEPPRSGSHIIFHGWSPDSRLVAYTRERYGRGAGPQRMQRFVLDGVFAGFGRMVGGDVETYARERKYVVTPAARRQDDATTWIFRVAERDLVFEIEVGAEQHWSLGDGERELARHAFDRIYVGFDPALYVSPDGQQAVLVMHLDAGWEIDAAIYPVRL